MNAVPARGAALVLTLGWITFFAVLTRAEAPVVSDEAPARLPAGVETSVEDLAKRVRDSVVIVTYRGREGRTEGLGTGFVIRPDGWIATNYHVIGEARPIQVQLADGQVQDVTEVVASDRLLDLAILKIAAKKLPALPLGDASQLAAGQAVLALGNPQGLTHSVVSGVVSARREMEGRPMIQLAIPIEPGNSGGPVLDLRGRVVGIVNMKSLITPNLGFAIEINALEPLIAQPNPITMPRWLTIGALDEREWKTVFGGRWSQRAGRISVEGTAGPGTGFGGRGLCLSQLNPPELPYEVAVAVKFEPEGGAAGLAFHADGRDQHYGFYPSGESLRLSRFEGPDVFSWKVLQEVRSPSFRPGAWNWLKVRVEADRLRCYVNDTLVCESREVTFQGGRIGLAKFRNTTAEFKQFQVAKELPLLRPAPELIAQVQALADSLDPQREPGPEFLERLVPAGQASVAALRDEADRLEQQAAALRTVAVQVHQQQVRALLADAVRGTDEEIPLVRACLLLARLDNEDLDVAAYEQEVERLAAELKDSLPADASEAARIDRLNQYLFAERGFHGSRGDYYNRSNSYLNEVLDDREGLPLTLSVLYLALGRKLDLRLEGVGLPGHFMVRWLPRKGQPVLIDTFDHGKKLTRKEAQAVIADVTEAPLEDEHWQAVGNRAILLRMVQNLLGIPRRARDAAGMLPYLETLVVLDPRAAEFRWMRAVVCFQLQRYRQAREDVAWILEHPPLGLDLEEVRHLEQLLHDAERRQNER